MPTTRSAKRVRSEDKEQDGAVARCAAAIAAVASSRTLCLPSVTESKAAVDLNSIASIPLFASVPRRRRWHVARLADEVGVPTGAEVTRQGSHAEEFFVVVSGTADMFRDGERVGALEPGDFGEVGLLATRWERSATVVATSPMRLLVLARRQLRELLFAAPTVAAPIRRAAAARA
jgi:CRP/FNR family cyclic AMP-dependent transcriptional regulator